MSGFVTKSLAAAAVTAAFCVAPATAAPGGLPLEPAPSETVAVSPTVDTFGSALLLFGGSAMAFCYSPQPVNPALCALINVLATGSG